jgi:hypothetical protein
MIEPNFRVNRRADENAEWAGSNRQDRCNEDARQVARDIAKTKQYKISMKLRKKVEMLFAHLKRILGLGRLRLWAETDQPVHPVQVATSSISQSLPSSHLIYISRIFSLDFSAPGSVTGAEPTQGLFAFGSVRLVRALLSTASGIVPS